MGLMGHLGLRCDALPRSLCISPISHIGPIRGTSLESGSAPPLPTAGSTLIEDEDDKEYEDENPLLTSP
jgi:hypothetical protein